MPVPKPKESSLGLDISKLKVDACLYAGENAHHKVFSNSREGFKQLLLWLFALAPGQHWAVLEATGQYGDLAARSLHDAGHLVALINPRWIKDHGKSCGRRNKTDRVDAELIASYGLGHEMDRWMPPAPEVAALRGLLRRLSQIEKLQRAEACRDGEPSHSGALRASLRRVVDVLKKESKRLQLAIGNHLALHPGLKADIERLTCIKGIGLKSACWLVAELPRHLKSSHAAGPWAGVAPRLHQSGTSVSKKTGIGREGSTYLKQALFMAAVVTRHKNPRFKAFADRLAAAGKAKMVVIIAVLHKLIRTAFALLKNQSSYDSTHLPSFIAKKTISTPLT